jgi:hypothetical protein
MDPIYPVNEEVCSRLIGAPVCAVLNDGTRHYGIISRVEDGKLILNDGPEPEIVESSNYGKRGKSKANISAKQKSSRGKTAAKQGKAQINAFGPAGFGYPHPFGGRIAIELATIAFLFLLFL